VWEVANRKLYLDLLSSQAEVLATFFPSTDYFCLAAVGLILQEEPLDPGEILNWKLTSFFREISPSVARNEVTSTLSLVK